ncbi:cell surface glycoprotein MUC18-like isoform X1 [Cyprinus carpio]|uniref:Cell surface glycoprotein MUC18-like isoform X1 n=1 Tax=Cyprinus carpio TaxID=7962 RepID=A0A9Q9VHC0_CYPCA|nr:cell surface glycoprotein MUC18-like isoform X1 [Cyprinus carpio]XP_018972116.1 cell surface glycoprotein MUC18-like isoform X1 [Cyprinus carpio]
MTLRYIALLIAGLSVLTCKTWAMVDVNMEDRVEVSLKGQAEISCIYTLKEPAKMIVWFTKSPGRDQSRKRVYYYDTLQKEIIDEGSEYAGRINFTHSHEPQNSRGSALLIINNVQLSDQKEYICTVHDVSTDSGEGHTLLQIFNSPSLPVIEGTHTGISVTAEEPSKVAHCKVDDGYPRPNITWYKDRFPLQQSNNEVKISESETTKANGLFTVESDLYIKPQRTDEDALFYCEVKYFVPGEVRMTESKKINITVHYPTTKVTVYVNPRNGLIKEGDTVEIRCEGNGNPQPVFSFTHNEEELSADNEMLLLENVKRSHSGTYVCQSIDFGEGIYAEDSVNITVHYLDQIVVTPEETVLNQGDDLPLTCNALSSLPTQTSWFKDGTWLGKGHVLVLHNASYDTAGLYVCQVTVSSLHELQKQNSVQISVRGKPKFTKEIEVGPVNKADRSVNLTCYAEGFPFPNITWTLSDQRTGQPVPVPEAENQMTDTGVISMISVRAMSELTAKCSAANELGTEEVSRKIQASARATTTTTQATSPKGTELPVPSNQPRTGGGSGVIIAVLIICLLLIAILGSVLYFLYKKGKLPCGRSGKQDFTKQKASKDDIVMEMKSGKSEEAVLLQGVNGDKKSPTE